MPTKGTTVRSVRVDDDLWRAAKTKAETDGRDLSEIIRHLLQGWIEGDCRV